MVYTRILHSLLISCSWLFKKIKFDDCMRVTIFLVFVIISNFPDQYKTVHCKSTNKNRVCNKWYHTYHNSLENFNQFIDKFPKFFYSEITILLICFLSAEGSI